MNYIDKSTIFDCFQPLSNEESARYEDLSKAFFEDFYAPNTFKDKAMRAKEMDEESEQSTRNTSTPTDVRLMMKEEVTS